MVSSKTNQRQDAPLRQSRSVRNSLSLRPWIVGLMLCAAMIGAPAWLSAQVDGEPAKPSVANPAVEAVAEPEQTPAEQRPSEQPATEQEQPTETIGDWFFGSIDKFLAIAALIGVLLGLGKLLISRRDPQGIHRLRKIYHESLVASNLDAQLQGELEQIINDSIFFREYCFDLECSRREELIAFSQRLGRKEAEPGLERFFRELLNRGRPEPAGSRARDKFDSWQHEVDKERQSAKINGGRDRSQSVAHHQRRDGYVSIIFTDDDHYRDGVIKQTRLYFSDKPPCGIEPKLDPISGEADPAKWPEAIETTARYLEDRSRSPWRLHVTLGARHLWCFALGVRMNNRTPIVVYHWHSEMGAYFPVWTGDRSVKDAMTPGSVRTHELNITHEEVGEGSAVAMAIQLGKGQVLTKSQGLFSSLGIGRCDSYTRQTALDPANPQQWSQVAAELAFAIANLNETDLYMFADWPAALAMMVGNAIGHDAGPKNIRLMQWSKEEKTYEQTIWIKGGKTSMTT